MNIFRGKRHSTLKKQGNLFTAPLNLELKDYSDIKNRSKIRKKGLLKAALGGILSVIVAVYIYNIENPESLRGYQFFIALMLYPLIAGLIELFSGRPVSYFEKKTEPIQNAWYRIWDNAGLLGQFIIAVVFFYIGGFFFALIIIFFTSYTNP